MSLDPLPEDDRVASLRRRVMEQGLRVAALEERSRAVRRAACETGMRVDMGVLTTFARQLQIKSARRFEADQAST